jgi:serine/threonine protein phosphatase 1
MRSVFGHSRRVLTAANAPAVPAGQRVYAIGDIHGRSDLLDRQHLLIDADLEASPAPAFQIVYLGDYIDRGPDSSGVLERLAGRSQRAEVTLLRGNHEEMLLRFLESESVGTTWRQLGGLETILSYGVSMNRTLAEKGFAGLSEELKKNLPPHHLKHLRRLQASTTIGDYFFCHAGVRPGVPLELQRDQDLIWIRGEFLSSTEDFGKTVVHGHSPTPNPEFKPNRINIDTGAYATGKLTCLVLEGTGRRVLTT